MIWQYENTERERERVRLVGRWVVVIDREQVCKEGISFQQDPNNKLWIE